jgi:hypothetical protein
VVSGLQDDDLVVRDEVDQAVLVGDTARPRARQGVLERLGFADARMRIAQGVPDEPVIRWRS